MSAVYNLRSHKLDNFIVTKFDDDFNIESYYEMTVADGEVRCGCPAGVRPTCRHRQMFAQLLTRLDTAWFLDFDTRAWVDPTGEASNLSEATASSVPSPQGVQSLKVGQADMGSIPTELHTETILEESQPQPEPITKLDDSHPFRRRM